MAVIPYRHSQRAHGLAWLLGAVAIAVSGTLIGAMRPPGWIAGFGLAVMLVLIATVFTSLTIVVTPRELEHHFGLGFWHKRYPLRDIASVAPVRSRWWYGFGIRLTPHGWLYNVWGLDAVEVRLSSGRTFRLGTDDQATLVARVRSALDGVPR